VGPPVHAEGLAPSVPVIFNPRPGAWAERLKIPADLVTPIRTT
jgi:NADPH2:quinone reductase